jgi:MOSC domain-containing protein YiiM
MGDPAFPQRFAAAGRPGAYLRIIREGELGAGDPVRVVHRPNHGVTVGDVAEIYHHNHAGVARLLTAPELAAGWREWAKKVGRHR